MNFSLARRTFDKARKTRDNRVKLDRNTYLERLDANTFGVRLHDTIIVRITRYWIELDSGGWHTMTTADRMREFSPVDIGNHGTGWSVFPMVDGLLCYCQREDFRSTDAIVVKGEKTTGKGLHFTGEYDESQDDKKLIYEWVTCRTCEGTGLRKGYDWDSGGYPCFDGIRVKPDGSKLMATQPRKPKDWHPVITVSGFELQGPGLSYSSWR